MPLLLYLQLQKHFLNKNNTKRLFLSLIYIFTLKKITFFLTIFYVGYILYLSVRITLHTHKNISHGYYFVLSIGYNIH